MFNLIGLRVGPVDIQGVRINAAGARTISNFHLDESLFAPATSPGVLNFPVVCVAVGIVLRAVLCVPIFDLALLNTQV